MSTVNYNSIPLDLVKTNVIEREPILSSDGTTYLYMRWTHDFYALWNPEANSFNDLQARKSGNLPHVTDANLLHYLTQNRRTYIWTVDGTDVIRSPAAGMACDMKNGPIVEVHSIQEIHGARTWVIHMRITTYVNQCPEAPVILSHRWRPSVDVDENQYSTLTIEGEAEFNIPKLIDLSRHADNYRVNMGHRIPTGFKREGIQVVVAPNGGTLNYSFKDVEQAMQLGRNCPGTTVSAVEQYGWTGTGLTGVLLGGIDAALEGAQTALSYGAFGGGLSLDVPGRGIDVLSKIASIAIGGVRGIMRQLPTFKESVKVRVKGSRESSKSNMLAYAVGIAFARIGAPDFFGAKRSSFVATVDLAGKEVAFELSHEYSAVAMLLHEGGLQNIANNISGAFREPNAEFDRNLIGNMHGFSRRFFGSLDGIHAKGEEIASGPWRISENPQWGNPSPRNARGTRGTWLEKLVTNSLLDPCEGPSLNGLDAVWENASDAEEAQV